EAQTLKLTFNEEIYIRYMEEVPDMKEYGFKSPEHFTYTIKDGKKNGSWELTIIPLYQYKLRDNIQIPIYPTAKAKEFSHLICDEFVRIKIWAEYVLEQIESREKLNLYAIKNITKAKKLHHDAGVLIANLQKEQNTESVFIIFVLDLFIIQTIKLYQKLFKSFIDSPLESEFELKTELYTLAFSGHAGFVTGEWNEKKSHSHSQGIQENETANSYDSITKKSQSTLSEVCESDAPQYQSRKGETFSESNNTPPKYTWRGQINVLVDVFTQMMNTNDPDGLPMLSMSCAELQQFLSQNFVDKKGHILSPHTLRRYLSLTNDDKKIHPDSPKRMNISDQL
ncbi:MAG: hypothetical protein KKD63_16195, partial [Proteobacteria bacterium]|nr:hypothetical protein [Pseudomonadota bacterium]